MLKILKSLLFSFLFFTYSYGAILTWGGYTKIDITKNEVDDIIKTYIDKTYPKEVQKYNKQLSQVKQEKLDKVSNISFVHNNLMWQDTPKNSSLLLNQLEARRYCKKLVLAKRKDWRLPTYKELLELVDYTKVKPASFDFIQHINSSTYWSDTQKHLKKKERLKTYWFVDFTFGESDFSSEMELKNLRCVRQLSSKKDDY